MLLLVMPCYNQVSASSCMGTITSPASVSPQCLSNRVPYREYSDGGNKPIVYSGGTGQT